jgi:ParB family chromosome partitioning protein
MKKHKQQRSSAVASTEPASPRLPEVLEILLTHIHPDPNQPRTEFDDEAIEALATSILSQGLMQYPTVNKAYKDEKGVQHYYLKAGERRWHAHLKLSRTTMPCVVLTQDYGGTKDAARILAQAAENVTRKGHTHAELIRVVDIVITDEFAGRAARGEQEWGAMVAIATRIGNAFGQKRSKAWAENYITLTKLDPELRPRLDLPEGDPEKLNFMVALRLAPAPRDLQLPLLEECIEKTKGKSGAALQKLVSVRVREVRESAGEAVRGTKPSAHKRTLTRILGALERTSDNFVGHLKSSECKGYMRDLASHLSTIETDSMIHDIKQALIPFTELIRILEEQRTHNYAGFSVTPPKEVYSVVT